MAPMACPDANALQDLLAGQVSAVQRATLAEHLDGCRECREVVAELARAATASPSAGALGAGAAPPAGEAASAATVEATLEVTLGSMVGQALGPAPIGAGALPIGTQLGRYVLGEVLGAGAMGVVYRADDPKLGRQVAVKLLRRPDPRLRERLSREARAMAQVNHPNVVAVYDVGAIDDQVYVAMELVRGQTLREWQRARQRSVVELIEIYAAAGRGLAAAHAAGVVHRDFKPDNVLIGEDGRARVTDFGLAGGAAAMARGRDRLEHRARAGEPRGAAPPDTAAALAATAPALATAALALDATALSPVAATTSAAPRRPAAPPPADALAATAAASVVPPRRRTAELPLDSAELRLTQTGATLGTPVYMSPEQFDGGNVDPRSDQWAFCVSLHEALFGRRPFRGDSFEQLAANVAAGVMAPLPAARVSPALRRIVHRGLAVRPGDRHPTMLALLGELGRDRAAPWRRLAVLAASVAALVGMGLGADGLLRQRAEESATQFFRATGAQLERSVALRYQSFVALADASYSVPVMHKVLGHKDQADFGLGDQAEDSEHLATVHDNLTSADWISWAQRSSRATIAVGDYKGRLLLTSAAPERWGSDLLVLPAARAAFEAVQDGAASASPRAAAPSSGGAMVVRYDDARVVAAQLYGEAAPAGLAVLFARALVVGGVPLGLFVQSIDGAQLLADVSVGEDVLLSLVAADGSAVGAVPAAVTTALVGEAPLRDGGAPAQDGAAPAEPPADPLARSGVVEARAGGELYLAQRQPLRGLDSSSLSSRAIATLVLARRIDPGLAGLFAHARLVLALAAVLLLGVAGAASWRARRLALT
jgi:serine/threonine protein kinase